MNRMTDKLTWIAMALVAVALVGVLTPVCTMPDCDDVSAGTCSDFIPACNDCPDSVVMKHTHDDAVVAPAAELDAPVAVATAVALPVPVAPSLNVSAPEATASPPPLDPLGVRLTV